MSARPQPRAAGCGRPEAIQLLARAEALLAAAALVVGEDEFVGVTAALTVLAGIAASDAACCAALGERHRGPDHRAAVRMLATVEPGGEQMARDLRRLLDRKDDAHYGVISTAAGEEATMLRWATRLVDAARSALEA